MILWIEVAVLAALALPIVQILRRPVVVDALREHAALLVLVTVAVIGAAALILMSFEVSAVGLHLLTATAAIAAGLAWIRASPSYGRSRRLPPGSLGLSASLDAIRDEHFYENQADQWGPVFKMSQFFRPVACIVDLETGFEFFERNSQALRQTDLPFAQLIPGGYLEFMDGPEHTVYRTAFRDAIKATLNESPEMMACATRVFFDSLAEASAAGEIDPAPELDRFAFTNLLQIVLGIEADDPRFERLVDGYTTLDYQLGLGRALPTQLRESYDRLSSEVREILAVEAKYPDDATKPRPASIARSLVAEQGLLPDDETVIGNLIFMVQIGSNNLGGFLLWVLELTSRHPQCLDLLRSLPPGASHESSDIETAIVHEVLRLRQSEYVYRIAQSDLVLDQFVIPRGWMIRLCLRECHRRADIYDEPSAFLPQRMLDGSVRSAAFAPFSRGAHSCVAIALVTKVARIFVRQLADGFDCQASATGPVERGDRHWNHWRPSSNFRIRINHRHGTGADTAMGNST